MELTLTNILILVFIPSASVFAGGLLAFYSSPSLKTISVIQHFTGGLILAAVSVELISDLTKSDELFALVAGFSFGVALMMGMKLFVEKLEENDNGDSRWPRSLIATVGIDMLIDGLLVGISFAIGFKQGVIITIALTLELFFLTYSTNLSLVKQSLNRKNVILITGAFVLLLVGGIALGRVLSANLTGAVLIAFIAFSTAALLYLVVEELLVEAHKQPETPLATVMFFVGFLILFLLEA